MGQILSQPVTEKATEQGEDSRLYFGVSSMQGWRVSMEDSHAAILSLKALKELPTNTGGDKATSDSDAIAYFGVYDGHGGDRTALYAGAHTHEFVANSAAFAKGDYSQALMDGFLATDSHLVEEAADSTGSGQGLDASGCAATAVIVVPHKKVICGNSGDSRTVLGRCGTAKALSFDHKPDNEGERSRICAGGGFVDMGRVNGNLALSRALGDMNFKKNPHLAPEQQIVTAYPDTVEHPLDDKDEFIVLACDGIWDCMTSQEVVEFVRRGVADGLPLEDICELLMEECLAPESDLSGVGCDNMTVCLVALLQPNQTRQEWYESIAKRVANCEGPVADRTTDQVRDQINARSQPSSHAPAPPSDRRQVEVDETSQMVLQQIFGGGDGPVSLDPDATSSLLESIGIQFSMRMPENESGDSAESEDSASSEPEHAEHAELPNDNETRAETKIHPVEDDEDIDGAFPSRTSPQQHHAIQH